MEQSHIGDTLAAGVNHMPTHGLWKRLAPSLKMPQPSKHRPLCKHTNSYKVVQARRAEESQESERAEGA